MTILNESIKGVDIIRSSHMENKTMEKMYKKLDERFGISLYADGSLRWYNLRRSFSSQIFFGLILFYMVYYSKNYSAKSIAIILQTTEDFITLLVNTSMYISKLEISMIGLERCKILLKIETEKNPEKNITKELEEKNWPNEGKINFINFSVSYRPDTPLVLKDINFEIKPGEKIGIVGRTGSGKSSLVLSLCRMIEPKLGKILIDGEDIKNIQLEYLRSKLSIVAQDPFLIESTVRDNIDPLRKYTDEEILEVMDDFGIFKKMGKEKLNVKIKEGGKNLSLGEKQLISFARAIIKKNKIIILDEATSSLDKETEKIIQKNMKFYCKDSTVIMIAHHLQMVQGCQTILVMDNGKIVEVGSYNELLKDKNSKFYSLYIREEENE
jgi:ATP-binding cassette subfamily C (CFTR/MRP) protein 1